MTIRVESSERRWKGDFDSLDDGLARLFLQANYTLWGAF